MLYYTHLNNIPGADNGIYPNHSIRQTGPIRGNGCSTLDREAGMKYNTVLAILFVAIAIFASIAVYSNALRDQAAMQAGLQECVVTFHYGVKTAWQKECTKPN